MRITLKFLKQVDDQVTPVTIEDAFRLMVLEHIPQWNVPIVDLKNKEIFFTATLVNPNAPRI
jgi:hypothetical protein